MTEQTKKAKNSSHKDGKKHHHHHHHRGHRRSDDANHHKNEEKPTSTGSGGGAERSRSGSHESVASEISGAPLSAEDRARRKEERYSGNHEMRTPPHNNSSTPPAAAVTNERSRSGAHASSVSSDTIGTPLTAEDRARRKEERYGLSNNRNRSDHSDTRPPPPAISSPPPPQTHADGANVSIEAVPVDDSAPDERFRRLEARMEEVIQQHQNEKKATAKPPAIAALTKDFNPPDNDEELIHDSSGKSSFWHRRRYSIVLVVVLLLALGGGGAGYALSQGSYKPRESTNAPAAPSSSTLAPTITVEGDGDTSIVTVSPSVPPGTPTDAPTTSSGANKSQEECAVIAKGQEVPNQESMVKESFNVLLDVSFTDDSSFNLQVQMNALQSSLQEIVAPKLAFCAATRRRHRWLRRSRDLLEEDAIHNVLFDLDMDQENQLTCDSSAPLPCYRLVANLDLYLEQEEDTLPLVTHISTTFGSIALSELLDSPFKKVSVVGITASIPKITQTPTVLSTTAEPTTPEPTEAPTPNPSQAPTPNPTPNPTQAPTPPPTPNPTQAPTPNPTPNPTLPPTATATVESSSEKFNIDLSFTTNNPLAGFRDTITVTYYAPVAAWLGIGVSPSSDGTMIGSEVIIVKPYEGTIRKYRLGDKAVGAIVEMDQQTLINTSFHQSGGKSILEFTKVVNESGELPWVVVNGKTHWIYAFGTSNVFGKHAGTSVFDLNAEL